jgi:AcrR family transcriptional regulator
MPKVVAGYRSQARDRIVGAARAVFRRKGFRSATMDDIAREVGVSKGALYLYFRTKSALLAEIQVRTRRSVLASWERLIEGGDVAEGIAASLDAVFTGEVDPGVWHELAAEAATDPEVRNALRTDAREDRKAMRRFLHRLEQRGRLRRGTDCDILAHIVMSLLHASVLDLMFRGPDRSVRRDLVRALRVLLGA